MQNSLVTGAVFFWQGLKLIFSPGVRKFLIVPIIINIFLLSFVFFLSAHFLNQYFENFISGYPRWIMIILGWLFWSIFWFSSLLISSLTFTILTNLIGSPFYGLLAEETAKMLYPVIVIPHMSWWQLLPITLLRECRKILYFIPWLLLSLILFIIPFTIPFAPIISFLIFAWIFAIQYIDYEADNERIPLKEMISRIRKYPLTCVGFGAAITLCMMIPGANLFVPPAAVAGGTALWLTVNNKIQ